MTLAPVEHLVLVGAAVMLLGGILVGLAGTSLYPLVLGAEIVALFYVLVIDASALATIQSFILKGIGG